MNLKLKDKLFLRFGEHEEPLVSSANNGGIFGGLPNADHALPRNARRSSTVTLHTSLLHPCVIYSSRPTQKQTQTTTQQTNQPTCLCAGAPTQQVQGVPREDRSKSGRLISNYILCTRSISQSARRNYLERPAAPARPASKLKRSGGSEYEFLPDRQRNERPLIPRKQRPPPRPKKTKTKRKEGYSSNTGEARESQTSLEACSDQPSEHSRCESQRGGENEEYSRLLRQQRRYLCAAAQRTQII